MRNKIRNLLIFIGLIMVGTIVVAEKSWWDRFFPKKEPQFLQENSAPPPVTPDREAVSLQDSFARVAEVVQPAVVNISAVQIQRVQTDPHQFFFGDPNEFFYRFFGDPRGQRQPREREFRTEGTGSGVIIDPDGYILTNNHVVQEADELTVTLASGKTFKGTVIGTDPRTDLAIIRIKSSNPFSFVPLGDSSAMRIGDWVLAFGSPFGLQQTVTVGIVSAIRQSLNIEGRTFANLIQTDAAINRGNSGGPLVNLRGEVIGINTAIYAPTGVFSGIGFAIPVNEAKKILQDLIEKGYVERSWMGVEIVNIDEIMKVHFDLKSTEGALVNQVIPDSPAERGGLNRGDVIVAVNDRPVKDVTQLQNIIGEIPPGTLIRVNIIRKGTLKSVKVKTELIPTQQTRERIEKPKKKEEPNTSSWLGADFSDISPRLAQAYGHDDVPSSGIIAVDVSPDSLAAEAGLMEGDIIRSVNRIDIESIGDLKKKQATLDPKKGLVFDVLRRGRSFYLSFKSL